MSYGAYLNRNRAAQQRGRQQHGHAVAQSRARSRSGGMGTSFAPGDNPGTNAPIAGTPPTSPAPPPGASLAGDPGLLAAQDAGLRDRGQADAQLGFTLGTLGASYGYDTAGGIDPNNPYSRAALLQESFRRDKVGNTNSYAGQGQLYSGALRNAQDESGRQYNIGDDQLRKGYQAQTGQAVLDRTGAYNATYSNETAALLAALLAATGGKK